MSRKSHRDALTRRVGRMLTTMRMRATTVLSARALSVRAGLSPTYVTVIERGGNMHGSMLSISAAMRIASTLETLGVPHAKTRKWVHTAGLLHPDFTPLRGYIQIPLDTPSDLRRALLTAVVEGQQAAATAVIRQHLEAEHDTACASGTPGTTGPRECVTLTHLWALCYGIPTPASG